MDRREWEEGEGGGGHCTWGYSGKETDPTADPTLPEAYPAVEPFPGPLSFLRFGPEHSGNRAIRHPYSPRVFVLNILRAGL